jgi:hypothetical protein
MRTGYYCGQGPDEIGNKLYWLNDLNQPVPMEGSVDDYSSGLTLEQSLSNRGSLVIADGALADEKWPLLVQAAQNVNNEYDYKAVSLETVSFDPTLNSNSFIASVLYHAGLSLEGSYPASAGSAPGDKHILGLETDETLTVQGQFVALSGGGGTDVLVGDERANALLGGRDDDVVRPGAGDDYVHGGQQGLALGEDGYDTADYSANSSNDGITVGLYGTPNEWNDFVVQDGLGGTDNLRSIERVIGTAGVDTLDLSGAHPFGADLRIDGMGVTADGLANLFYLGLYDGDTLLFRQIRQGLCRREQSLHGTTADGCVEISGDH